MPTSGLISITLQNWTCRLAGRWLIVYHFFCPPRLAFPLPNPFVHPISASQSSQATLFKFVLVVRLIKHKNDLNTMTHVMFSWTATYVKKRKKEEDHRIKPTNLELISNPSSVASLVKSPAHTNTLPGPTSEGLPSKVHCAILLPSPFETVKLWRAAELFLQWTINFQATIPYHWNVPGSVELQSLPNSKEGSCQSWCDSYIEPNLPVWAVLLVLLNPHNIDSIKNSIF